MSTALKKADLPFLFDKDHVSFSSGWCWDDQAYWGQAGEVAGIVPPRVKMDVPHDQKSIEYWFYFGAISRAVSCAATMNGEMAPLPDFHQVCNKLTKELMKESIENGTPVDMLLSEYEMNGPFKQPDLSDFYVVKYKQETDSGKAIHERQRTHKWIMAYVKKHAEDAMCQRCGEREHDIKALFSNEERGDDEQLLCWGCFDEWTAVESAWSFTKWYEQLYSESWTGGSNVTADIKSGYESYCDDAGVVPFWDNGESQEEEEEKAS